MTETREGALPPTQADAPTADVRGWYLYGITRRGALATPQPERGDGDRGAAAWARAPAGDEGEPVQVLDCDR